MRWQWPISLICCVVPVLTVQATNKSPDVVWIIADDHAAYVYGAYGNRKIRTPSLDRLAAEGMRCDRAYCSSPVCTASRQSFLTGRYPRIWTCCRRGSRFASRPAFGSIAFIARSGPWMPIWPALSLPAVRQTAFLKSAISRCLWWSVFMSRIRHSISPWNISAGTTPNRFPFQG